MTETTSITRTYNPRRMRLVLLIILIIVLVAINIAYRPLADWNNIQQGEPGDLLYAAGFDGFEDEWRQYNGRLSAQVVDGVMRLSLETPSTIYSPAPIVVGDFDVRVTVQSVEGIPENDGYGLIFRLGEGATGTNCARQFVIVCALETLPVLDTAISLALPAPQSQANGYYVFLISNDGYYQVLKGDTESNVVEPVTIWHYSDGALNEGVGAQNDIRVVGQGNQFSFFLNGEPALLCVPLEGQQPTGTAEDCLGEETYIWEDDTFSQGKLGVVLNGATQAGDIVEFDNFTVIMPDDIIFEGNNA